MRSAASVAALLALGSCQQLAERVPAAIARHVAAPLRALGYQAVGLASWYGEEVAGNLTASGAPFVPAAMTAAHRTLPLGSVVEVTALDSGRRLLVLINDRGPGRREREIDLSRGAARALGLTRSLFAVRVRAVAVGGSDLAALRAGGAAAAQPRLDHATLRATRAVAPAVPAMHLLPAHAAPLRAGEALLVQAATFTYRPRAEALAARLGGSVDTMGQHYRVRLGPFLRLDQAQRARDAALAQGYGDAGLIRTDLSTTTTQSRTL